MSAAQERMPLTQLDRTYQTKRQHQSQIIDGLLRNEWADSHIETLNEVPHRLGGCAVHAVAAAECVAEPTLVAARWKPVALVHIWAV